MSIFFASGNISDSQQSQNQQIIKNQKVKPTYSFGDGDDYGDHDKKRTVQTQKDKKWNLIKNLCIKINNQLNNQDFEKVWDNLQQLLKEVQKAAKVIEKQGKYPHAFMKTLKRIDDDVTAYAQSTDKKLNKNATKAFNTMKQKLRNKIIPEFEAQLKKFTENEAAYLSEQSGEQQEFQSDESDEESDEEGEDRGDWRSQDIMIRRKYFLKKQNRRSDDRKESKQITQKDGQQIKQKQTVKQEKKKQPKYHLTQVHEKKKIQIKSVKEAQAKIRNIINSFHKLTNKDQRQQYLDNLNEIVKQSKNYKDFEKLSFLLVDIPIRIQVYRQMKLTHFQRSTWLTIFKHIQIIYNILRESQQDGLLENVQLFTENNAQKITTGQQLTIYRALQAFLIILQSQLRKSFMFIDKSDVQYSQRLQDLIKILNFMYKVSRDMSFHEQLNKQTVQLSYKVLQNMYYMSSNFMQRIKSGTQQEMRFTQLSDQTVLQQFCDPILRSRNQQNITKTILYLVFNHAVNQRQKAKQLLIMSNIPDSISQCDYYTQAIYNRCIVQIGINAFHFGKYFEVQQFLSEICSAGKSRDQTKDIIRQYLAQGFAKGLQQKQVPRNKILPYYLHLNVQLIESLELIASMILQIPYTLTEGGKITSKTFKKVYFEYERSHFIAEPLNHRDLIYAASSQLKQGNWQECYNRLVELEIWRQVQNVQFAHKNMLQTIKQYSLKCYLLANRKCYRSISLANLSAKFQMQQRNIKKLISKWIYSRQIQGSINDKGFLILSQKKHSQMQKLCENLYNKLEQIRGLEQQMLHEKYNPQQGDEQQADKDLRSNRNFNLAMNEKLKAILSKRN